MKKYSKELIELAKDVRLLILDVDGVMTDGSIILDNKGNELKKFHVRDGHGIKMLIREGIDVAIITGRGSKVVVKRAKELGIKEVHQKCYKKIDAYKKIQKRLLLQDEQIAFIGDDIVDLPILMKVGLSVAVADADNEVKQHCVLITENPGGRCAVREVCDLILKSKGVWKRIIDGYTKD